MIAKTTSLRHSILWEFSEKISEHSPNGENPPSKVLHAHDNSMSSLEAPLSGRIITVTIFVNWVVDGWWATEVRPIFACGRYQGSFTTMETLTALEAVTTTGRKRMISDRTLIFYRACNDVCYTYTAASFTPNSAPGKLSLSSSPGSLPSTRCITSK